MTRRRALIAILGASLMSALVAAYFVVTSEWFIKRQLIAYVSGRNLTLEIGHARLRRGVLYATDLLATYGGEGEHTLVRVNIAGLKIDLAWWRLLRGRVTIEEIMVVEPQVTFIDDAAGRPTPSSDGSFAWPLVDVDDISVHGGTFTLVRLRDGTRAVLGVRTIEGHVGAFGSTPERREWPVTAEIKAQVGFSGETSLEVTARPTADEPTAEIDLAMTDQNLKDFGDFFEPNVGLSIRGRLRDGRAHLRLEGPRLVTTLTARFSGLALKLSATAERGPFATFATNLSIKFGTNGSNLNQPRAARTWTVVSRRRADDTILSLLTRGLKDAALKVVETPMARKVDR